MDKGTSKSSKVSNALPPGIKVLITYTAVITFFYLIYSLFGISKPISVFFGTFIYGTAATIIELTSLALLLIILYGLIKRHYWVFWISLAWFSFGAVNALVSLFKFRAEFDVLKQVLLLSSFIVIVLNGIIAWYIYSEKYYFKVKHLNKETKAKDKFFVYVISCFLIVSFLVLITFGVHFYRTTFSITNKLIVELKQDPYQDLVCAKKQGTEQDVCYLVLSIIREGQEPEICENIQSDFYKMTCYRSLE